MRWLVAIVVLVAMPACDRAASTPPALLLTAPVSAPPYTAPTPIDPAAYPWLVGRASVHGALVDRFPCPPGHVRIAVSPGSFAHWLRGLPLKAPGAPVLLHDGRRKSADVAAAVVDIDTGTRDLQQCADAVMRLRAEYLYAAGRNAELAFAFTSGHACRWDDYRAGLRPRIDGSRVSFVRAATADASRASFRRWMDLVFAYAGPRSLERELLRREPIEAAEPGDVLIEGGSPGHAVLVVDVCRDASGRTLALLAQSYMPAQDVHVLRNVRAPELGAWFRLEPGPCPTPEWLFHARDLRRWSAP